MADVASDRAPTFTHNCLLNGTRVMASLSSVHGWVSAAIFHKFGSNSCSLGALLNTFAMVSS